MANEEKAVGPRRKPQLLAAAAIALASLAASPLPVAGQNLSVVYEPTPHETVERMLTLANVRAGDTVIDLGSGDGRIAIAAARRGARALGVDLDPQRIREAHANAQRAGLTGRVIFRREDLFKTQLGDATVITLYLLPQLNARLAPRLMALRPGTRIVSHRFPMGDWSPDQTDTAGGTVYLWIVPARVEGRWRVNMGGGQFTAEFKQRYQVLSGTAHIGGAAQAIHDGRLRGETIDFTVDIDGRPARLRGVVKGNAMQGSPGGFGQQAPLWTAQRMGAVHRHTSGNNRH